MPVPSTPQFDLWITVIVTLISGAFAIGVTALFNYLAQKRQHRLDIQREMLSVIRDYSEKYYFQLFASAGATSSAIDSVYTSASLVTSREWLHLAFYRLCKFLRLLRDFHSDLRIYFLGSRQGEGVVAELQNKIWSELRDGEYSNYDLFDLMETVLNDETFKSFEDRVQYSSALKGKIEKFENFLRNKTEFGQLLQCYSHVLGYEIDLVFREWYKDWVPSVRQELGDKCLSIIRKDLKFEDYRCSEDH